jgi:hypothetical protein
LVPIHRYRKAGHAPCGEKNDNSSSGSGDDALDDIFLSAGRCVNCGARWALVADQLRLIALHVCRVLVIPVAAAGIFREKSALDGMRLFTVFFTELQT